MVGLDDVSFVISELDDADPLLREPFTVSEFVNRLPSKPVVADVGSNHGFYGVMAAVAGCDPVYLFEMSGDVVEGLKENIRSNGVGHRCTVVEKAVWSKNTRVPVETHHVHREEAIGAGEKTMEAITLDSFFAERPDPDIVKIDVEGAEINVLQGMESLLAAAKPVVFVEIHQRVPVGRWGEESTFDAVKHFLQEYGYGITVLDQTGTKNVVNIVAEPGRDALEKAV